MPPREHIQPKLMKIHINKRKSSVQGRRAVDLIKEYQGLSINSIHLYCSRRQDDRNDIPNVGGEEDSNYMCPSTVKYARPKRARTTSGDWKYIVNTGDYTQTLRLEMCMWVRTDARIKSVFFGKLLRKYVTSI